LIDPYGGEADLHEGILRHVSEAFAEDPLRVLRVARFAARFGFRIADDTLVLMRNIANSGELETLAPERVWQEVSRGLSEGHPSRMLDALRACGALARLLPEIEALYAIPVGHGDDAGTFTERALDWAALRTMTLPARYAVLAQELDRAGDDRFDARAGIERAEAMSSRLRVPSDCDDAARLAVRWHHAIADAPSLASAALLDLLLATDALRRPERLATLASAAAAHVAARTSGESNERRRTALLQEALAVVRRVDAAAIARDAVERMGKTPGAARGDAIASALRAARLAALREWKAGR
jgi:tRNA nucleotidyltransferase (CCA-adding enzyme)